MQGVDWQAEVAKLLPGWRLFDPKGLKSKDPATYYEWDIGHVEKASVFLAYMDAGNPSGYGLMYEAGYAAAEHKLIVFVDAMGDDPRSKYFDMLRVRANHVCRTLEEAAAYLKERFA
jgi:hypothetical protein